LISKKITRNSYPPSEDAERGYPPLEGGRGEVIPLRRGQGEVSTPHSKKRFKIVADDKIPFLKGILEPYTDIIYLPGSKITAADVADADAIFTRTRTQCNEKLLHQSRVRLIVTATIGYDHIDTAYCEANEIKWVTAPGCNSSSVQQYITAALLFAAKEKKWNLKEKTLGIIGVGNVGSKVAKAASALGMRVLLNDPPRAEKEGDAAFTPLNKLLEQSDIITCHTPLTKQGPYPTLHLCSSDFFDRMKEGSIYINTSRGAVTDSGALKQAVGIVKQAPNGLPNHPPAGVPNHPADVPSPPVVIAKPSPTVIQPQTVIAGLTRNLPKLSAYILDVWEGEPNIDSDLLENALIGTPHIAGYSSDGKANGTAVCVREFCRFFGLDALQDWYPDTIPAPPMPTAIHIDCKGKTDQQVYYEAVTHTYPIWEDSQRLKQLPATFEEQRGNYWIRREFGNFTIHLANPNEQITTSLHKLGFNPNNYPPLEGGRGEV